MLIRKSTLLCHYIFAIAISSLCIFSSDLQAGNIEAVEGKKYRITKQHGPWMIMVATLREPPEQFKGEGKSPAEAAEDLVYYLRKIGIPAYSFKRDETQSHVSTISRTGNSKAAKYNLREEYCVMAGNFKSPKDDVAVATLAYIKKLKPKCLEEGGIYHPTPGRPGPLSHAFLSVNPFLSVKELALHKKSPEIIYLNKDMKDRSLLNISGKHTVVVATFRGKSFINNNKSKFSNAKNDYDQNELRDRIDQMYIDAIDLCKLLRENNEDAYVLHNRYESIVTIGAFDSEKDSRIPKLQRKYGAKYSKVPGSNNNVLVGEAITLPKKGSQGERPVIFDPQPRLMQVPYYSE